MIEECRYAIKTVTPTDYELIADMSYLYQQQKRKVFDLAFWENGGTIENFCKEMVYSNIVFAIKDKTNNHIAAYFVMENLRPFKNIIINANLHCIVSKEYWGKTSRELCNLFREYLDGTYNIYKLTACVPQNAYGVIKLLKDIGFKHEGTIKKSLLFLDKNDKPKLYDNLIYGLQFMEEKEICQ